MAALRGGRDLQCFACQAPMQEGTQREAFTLDPQMQWVGKTCYRRIVRAGLTGYSHKGGMRLFSSLMLAQQAAADTGNLKS